MENTTLLKERSQSPTGPLERPYDMEGEVVGWASALSCWAPPCSYAALGLTAMGADRGRVLARLLPVHGDEEDG
ncbi:hypothetical protein V5F77_27320 [Xanthobacter sp. DSM 24535]|uniref:hypothetical protein n=1 Tax=Roseixanthobacter psychrophilus TaxID=3119917 RepID=UPI003728017E